MCSKVPTISFVDPRRWKKPSIQFFPMWYLMRCKFVLFFFYNNFVAKYHNCKTFFALFYNILLLNLVFALWYVIYLFALSIYCHTTKHYDFKHVRTSLSTTTSHWQFYTTYKDMCRVILIINTSYMSPSYKSVVGLVLIFDIS